MSQSRPLQLGTAKLGVAKLALPGILLIFACLIPYLNKAYTIDDPWFLLEAKQIFKTPLQPMSFPICWMDNEICLARASSLGAGTLQGLMGFLLVPVILAGGQEWIAHLLQMLLASIAVMAMVRLTLRLGLNRIQAAAAGLMLVAVPPFLAMASTAMPDTAALAIGLTGFERLLAWKDERRWHQAITAGLLMGIAPYARAHLALLIPLGALWLLKELRIRPALEQVRREAYLWIPILIAASILLLVNLAMRDRQTEVETKNVLAAWDSVPPNLYAYFFYLFFPIPFAAVWLATRWRRSLMLLLLSGIVVLALLYIWFTSHSLLAKLPMIFAACSVSTMAYMIYEAVREGDRTGLLLSLWVLVPFPAVIYAHFPIKYMLAMLPAVVLIILRNFSPFPGPRQVAAYGVVVVLCTLYSCLLLRADADQAEYGRRAAAELIAPRVAAGEGVWFGGEWGFYWYAERSGARISKPNESGPHPGELLAISVMEGGISARDRFPNRELIDARSYDAPHGHTMGCGAGLYSNFYGHLLWVWNPKCKNAYELWRVH